jgi:membrane-associated phospholipid phosphatase
MTTNTTDSRTHMTKSIRLLQPNDTWLAFLRRCMILILVPAASVSYLLTNQLSAGRSNPMILAFPFEPLPFIPAFIYFYISYHVLIVFSLFVYALQADHLPTLRRFVFALVTSVLIAAIIFILLPTTVTRPMINGDSLSLRITQFVYSNDQPYNCFPSLHVTWSLICCYYLQKQIGFRRFLTLLNSMLFIMICLSTLFVRQHYVLDVIGGVALGTTAVAVAETWLKRRWKMI